MLERMRLGPGASCESELDERWTDLAGKHVVIPHQFWLKRGVSAKIALTSALNRAGFPQGSAFPGIPERRGGDVP